MCVFCSIVEGREPAQIVFEDDISLAFLDARPVFLGHTLLVPKEHHETLPDLPVELVAPFFLNGRLLSAAVRDAMQADGTFVAMNNKVSQSVPHLHLHVVPRRRKDGLRGFFWPRRKYESAEQQNSVGESIRGAVGNVRQTGSSPMTPAFDLRSSDGLALEAELDHPEGPTRALVLCHPHPRMGGTMNAPLLKAVRDALVSSGWAVLRFNFRGIGRSEGEAGLGHDETMDAEGALAAMKERYPDLPLAIAGWSFGAAVAVRVAAKHPELVGCVAIAPAVKEKPGVTAGLPEPSEVDLAMPTLFLVGVNDDQTPPEACRAWAESAGISFSLMPGANHFFWAKYEKLAAEVVGFLEEAASSYLPRDEP